MMCPFSDRTLSGVDEAAEAGRYRAREGRLAALLLVLAFVCSLTAEETAPEASSGGGQDIEKPTSKVEHCTTEQCHASVRSHQRVHGPVAQDKCLACHEYVDAVEHRFRLIKKAEELCADCHALQPRTYVHQPLEKGNCLGCHDPHGSKWRMFLVADPTQGLCVDCHKQDGFAEKKFKHGPVAAGACILCHESHSSWQPHLLVAEPVDLCLRCHDEVVEESSDAARHVHEPLNEGCADCHDPHASDFRYQLRTNTPALCYSCHEDLQKSLEEAKVVHGVMEQPGACLDCHAAHSSFLPMLQRSEQREMCLSCHNKRIDTQDGRELTDMAALLAKNPNHHGPIREGSCSPCHRPHASEQANLLVKDYPPEFYAPYSDDRYALCFGCHIPELAKEENGVGLTRFRDGDRNLHWLHVNQEKGRTCRACHEVHASKKPFHVREAVPFGRSGWMLEINYEKTEVGGTCSPGCHETESYDHGMTGEVGTDPAGTPSSERAVPRDASDGRSP